MRETVNADLICVSYRPIQTVGIGNQEDRDEQADPSPFRERCTDGLNALNTRAVYTHNVGMGVARYAF